MNFLLDTNICSAYTKGSRNVSQRFLQYSGGLAISTITLAELYNGAYGVDDQRKTDQILNSIDDLLDGLQLVDYTANCSLEAGIQKGRLRQTWDHHADDRSTDCFYRVGPQHDLCHR
jgi:tRNA(fMet)-specific endonuclease VapC